MQHRAFGVNVTDDSLEENDIVSLATPISAGFEPSLVSCDGDEDWYTVDLAEGDQVEFDIVDGPKGPAAENVMRVEA